MRQDIKEQWVNALRSGVFRQGRRYLAKDGGYCCLGVLCELAYRDGVVTERVEFGDGDNSAVVYDGHLFALPGSVMEWAGLDDSNPFAPEPDRGRPENYPRRPLSAMNDNGKTFTYIADVIERYL